jgi:hypothetical protein
LKALEMAEELLALEEEEELETLACQLEEREQEEDEEKELISLLQQLEEEENGEHQEVLEGVRRRRFRIWLCTSKKNYG